jgi:membrane protein
MFNDPKQPKFASSWKVDKFGFSKSSVSPSDYTMGFLRRSINVLREFGSLLRETFTHWNDRDPFNNSTIIAFYTIFSLPGLLVIIINIAGYFYDKQEITTQLTGQIQAMIGGDTAKDIESIISKASEGKGSILSSILGIATLLFGATGVFYQLQQMLNKIWDVKPQVKTKHIVLGLMRDRLFSFGLILVVGFLLLVSLVLSATLNVLSTWVSVHLSDSFNVLFQVLDIVISLGVITFLFAAIFKFLPDVKIRWRDVWPGALLTAVLFVVAKFGLGLYFGKSDPGSTYGAAGSIVLIMLWVSYAAIILLFGAEFTRVYIKRHGKKEQKAFATVSYPATTENHAKDEQK